VAERVGAREVHGVAGFYRRGRNRAITARGHPALTRGTASNLDRRAQGRPTADWWTTPCADGGEGRDSTWRGRGLQGPRSAPNLGRSVLETARESPDAEVSTVHARARARRATSRRGAVSAGPTLSHYAPN
jgi:hypothetical protein